MNPLVPHYAACNPLNQGGSAATITISKISGGVFFSTSFIQVSAIALMAPAPIAVPVVVRHDMASAQGIAAALQQAPGPASSSSTALNATVAQSFFSVPLSLMPLASNTISQCISSLLITTGSMSTQFPDTKTGASRPSNNSDCQQSTNGTSAKTNSSAADTAKNRMPSQDASGRTIVETYATAGKSEKSQESSQMASQASAANKEAAKSAEDAGYKTTITFTSRSDAKPLSDSREQTQPIQERSGQTMTNTKEGSTQTFLSQGQQSAVQTPSQAGQLAKDMSDRGGQLSSVQAASQNGQTINISSRSSGQIATIQNSSQEEREVTAASDDLHKVKSIGEDGKSNVKKEFQGQDNGEETNSSASSQQPVKRNSDISIDSTAKIIIVAVAAVAIFCCILIVSLI